MFAINSFSLTMERSGLNEPESMNDAGVAVENPASQELKPPSR